MIVAITVVKIIGLVQFYLDNRELIDSIAGWTWLIVSGWIIRLFKKAKPAAQKELAPVLNITINIYYQQAP